MTVASTLEIELGLINDIIYKLDFNLSTIRVCSCIRGRSLLFIPTIAVFKYVDVHIISSSNVRLEEIQ